MGFGKIKKPSFSGAGIGSAIGGGVLGALSAGALAPVGAAAGGAIGGYAPELWNKIKGFNSSMSDSSANTVLPNKTAEQSLLINNYLYNLSKGAGKNIETLQGYAENGYNPYDEAFGRQAFADMATEVDQDRIKQLNAIKGSPLNRFSLASANAMSGVNANARKQLADLSMQRLGMETQGKASSYSNQMNALGNLLNQSNAMTGMSTFDNREDVKEGWLNKIGKITGIGADIAKIGSIIGG